MNLFSQLSSPCTFCPERGELLAPDKLKGPTSLVNRFDELLVPDKGREGSTSLVDRFGEC